MASLYQLQQLDVEIERVAAESQSATSRCRMTQPSSRRTRRWNPLSAPCSSAIQADAVTWVKDAMETRRTMRRARRFRKTPYRQPRANRLRNRRGMPPSTKARWQWKLRLCQWLVRLYPSAECMVESIKASTRGKPRWDRSFSPLEVGKRWFYHELGRLAPVQTRAGVGDETPPGRPGAQEKQAEARRDVQRALRGCLGVGPRGGRRIVSARANSPALCHPALMASAAVTALAARAWGQAQALLLTHAAWDSHGEPSFSTRSMDWRLFGGTLDGRGSLHHLHTGKRLCQNAKPAECRVRSILKWRARLLPVP